MTNVRKLTEGEYKASFSTLMTDVSADPGETIDIWPYVRSVSLVDFDGHEIWEPFVEHVYRGSDGRYDHVLVLTKTKNVYLSVIVVRRDRCVYGHYLLDLRKKYGLDT